MMTTLRMALAAVLVVGWAACNPTPIENLEKSLTLKVKTNAGTDEVVKVDFLWVVDNSTSMCEEQVGLASSFNTFQDKLSEFFSLDVRAAVTSTDMQCENITDGAEINAAKGKFNTKAATTFPASCMVSERVECRQDSDCWADLDPSEADRWECTTQPLEECIINPNGSINTTCRRKCQNDQECQDYFGPDFECLQVGGDPNDWGCIQPPSTESCPAELPEFLSTSEENLDLFPCAATLGVYAKNCYRYEQGLRGAYAALDPQGPNSEQARRFLRDDAYLVIIFVSDEDDCSTPDGVTFGEDEFNTCALTTTTDKGGKLVPVSDYVNKFRGLKKDPAKVIVAAISGSATPPQETEEVVPGCEGLINDFPAGTDTAGWSEYLQCALQAFADSKTDPRVCHQKSYVCKGEGGISDWGSRYFELAAGFGPNGRDLNLCDAGGLGPALDEIASLIISVVNSVCLPKQIVDEDDITITKTLPSGEKQTLVKGVDYEIATEATGCIGDQGEVLPSLVFTEPPVSGEEVVVEYQGVPFPELPESE